MTNNQAWPLQLVERDSIRRHSEFGAQETVGPTNLFQRDLLRRSANSVMRHTVAFTT